MLKECDIRHEALINIEPKDCIRVQLEEKLIIGLIKSFVCLTIFVSNFHLCQIFLRQSTIFSIVYCILWIKVKV